MSYKKYVTDTLQLLCKGGGHFTERWIDTIGITNPKTEANADEVVADIVQRAELVIQ